MMIREDEPGGGRSAPFSRRQFLRLLGGATAAGGLALAGGYVYATHVEPWRLVVEQVCLPLPAWRPELADLKLVQLSDFHLHPFTTAAQIEAAVEEARVLQPDVAVLTGDYVLATADAIFELAPILARLNPRLGIYAVLGNHDHWQSAAVVRQGLQEVGITLLHNCHVALEGGLVVAGVDDPWVGRPDLASALDGLSSADVVVLLAHEPDFADQFTRDPRVHLQLSGHSHGGQVRVPGIGAVFLPQHGQKYDMGLYQVQDAWVYTNRGLGVTGANVRLNCPPEITSITWKPAGAAAPTA